jgi:pSer/pThr/pTyr-binding forkhead associated (FHA) protein
VRPAAAAGTPPSIASGARLVAARQEWPLAEGVNVVGRDRDCAVRVNSATLSRHHARIVVAGGQATIEDLGSKNGTFVNQQALTQPRALKDRDEIQLGSETVTYRVLEPLPSTLTRHGPLVPRSKAR